MRCVKACKLKVLQVKSTHYHYFGNITYLTLQSYSLTKRPSIKIQDDLQLKKE